VERSTCPAVLWRTASKRATATGHGGAGDDVWQSPGVMVMLLAGADGKARTEAIGNRGARARVAVATMPVSARLGDAGTSLPGQSKPLLGQGRVPSCSGE
jgi:hypothetical protein